MTAHNLLSAHLERQAAQKAVRSRRIKTAVISTAVLVLVGATSAFASTPISAAPRAGSKFSTSATLALEQTLSDIHNLPADIKASIDYTKSVLIAPLDAISANLSDNLIFVAKAFLVDVPDYALVNITHHHSQYPIAVRGPETPDMAMSATPQVLGDSTQVMTSGSLGVRLSIANQSAPPSGAHSQDQVLGVATISAAQGSQGPVGPQGPPGPSGLTSGFSGPNGMVQNGNGQTTSVIGGTPIVSYIPASQGNGNYTGGSLAGFTNLSGQNLVANTENVTGNLTVQDGSSFGSATFSGSASVAGTFSAATSTFSTLTVSGPATFTGSTTIAGLTVTGFNPGLTLGSVAFQGATGLSQDNSNYFYNPTTHTLGLGTSSPTSTLFVQGSGSNNPFVVASSTGTQLLTVLPNGNVGIGTTSPIALFTVASPSNVGLFTVASNGSTTISSLTAGIIQSTANGSLFVSNQLASASTSALTVSGQTYLSLASSTGITTGQLNVTGNTFLANASSTNLTVSGQTYLGNASVTNLTLTSLSAGTFCLHSVNGLLQTTAADCGVGGGTTFWSSTTNAVYNNFGYKVGINSSTPTANLVVQGSSTNPTLPIFTVASSSNQSFLTVLANGNVGIGTTTPSKTLEVVGDSLGYSSIADLGLSDTHGYTGSRNWAIYNGASVAGALDFKVGTAAGTDANVGNYVMTILNNGNVGIGTTSPGQKLDVAGNINVSAGNAYMYNGINAITASTSVSNWFFGQAGNVTATGTYNMGFGNGALSALTSGVGNSALGASALQANTSGSSNVAIGNNALQANTTSSYNTAIGQGALTVNTGTFNTGIGTYALFSNTGGNYNVAIGPSSLAYNTTGSNNTAVGFQAGNSIVTGAVISNTTLLGYQAGFSLATSTSNILVGYKAGYDVTIGSGNLILGYYPTTGVGVTTGSNNILLGNDVRPASTTASGQLNIGNLIYATGLGTGSTLSSGNVGIGTTGPTGKLEVVGSIGTTPRYSAVPTLALRSSATAGLGVGPSIMFTGESGNNTHPFDFAAIQGSKDATGVEQYGGKLSFFVQDNLGNDLLTEAMTIKNTGNVGIGTTSPTLGPLTMASGAYVSAGGTWTNASDRNLKENFATLTPASILEKIDQLPVTEWNYKTEGPGVNHIGPVAQDFWAAFHLGNSSISISTIDPAGVALLGIQALDQKLEALQGSLTGNATTTGELTVYNPGNFSGDSVGEAKILSGQTSVRITFTQPYAYQPIVTATPVGDSALADGFRFTLEDIDASGFTIQTLLPVTSDTTFDWHSFASPAARLTVSDGSTAPIALIVPPAAPSAPPIITDPATAGDPSSTPDSTASTTPASAAGSSTPPAVLGASTSTPPVAPSPSAPLTAPPPPPPPPVTSQSSSPAPAPSTPSDAAMSPAD